MARGTPLTNSLFEKTYREAEAIGILGGPERIQGELIFSDMLRHGSA